jgi:hypothetical protein
VKNDNNERPIMARNHSIACNCYECWEKWRLGVDGEKALGSQDDRENIHKLETGGRAF